MTSVVRIPTPIPNAVVRAVRRLASGTLGTILWQVGLLVAGAVVVFYAVAVSAGYFSLFVVGILLTMAVGGLLRASFRDIWTRDFWTWNP